MIDLLLFSWEKNLGYAQRLIADLDDEAMVRQPAAGTNHPAWVLSHLNIYHPVIVSLIRGETFPDPKDHRYGMQSKPVADRAEYPSKGELIQTFATGHEQVESALRQAPVEAWHAAVTLPRWQQAMPTVDVALGYLMLHHEAVHLGQLSGWRRVQGLASV